MPSLMLMAPVSLGSSSSPGEPLMTSFDFLDPTMQKSVLILLSLSYTYQYILGFALSSLD